MSDYSKIDNSPACGYLFHPRRTHRSSPSAEYRDIDINVAEDIRLGCRLYIAEPSAPVLFFFHGNGETTGDYDFVAPSYTGSGINLLLFTYRGYGWSTGEPSVANFFADLSCCIDQAEDVLTAAGFIGPRLVMGRSLGSAAAIEVAVQYSDLLKGLVLESGFADTLPLLTSIGAPRDTALQEDDGFQNRKKIASVTMPTLILHGSVDDIIEPAQAEKLQACSGARTKKFFLIPGAGHNTMMHVGGEHYFTTIAGFIQEITGQTSWRKRRKQFKERQNQ